MVSISGSYSPGDTVIFNYERYLITVNGSNVDFIGQMEDILPGEAGFYITISGRNDGMHTSIEYNPRYY
jgi:hypothetical protein